MPATTWDGLPVGDGYEFLNPEVDDEFMAAVTDFNEDGVTRYELTVHELLREDQLVTRDDPKCRWVHLPANNVLMIKIFGHQTASFILSKEKWADRMQLDASGSRQRLSMIPSYTKYSDCEVLFMPYVHWDMLAAPGIPVCRAAKGRPTTPYQKLLAAYCDDVHPLHLRRTLDQYGHDSIEDTTQRDSDQVVSRYLQQRGLEPEFITMIDQLWLWVVPGGIVQSELAMIVSCFPQATQKLTGVAVPECRGSADILGYLRDTFSRNPMWTSDIEPKRIASVITSTCITSYADFGSTLRLGEIEVQPNTIYLQAINSAMLEETRLFERFSESTKQYGLVDITREVSLLLEMKDVQDELEILHDLRDLQGSFAGQSNWLEFMGDSVGFSKTTTYRAIASRVIENLLTLVNLKQNHSTMMDARATAIQGKTLMVFTVVTIVFLPLSFMAAFLAIDISQFERDSSDKMSLGYVSQIMFPISAAITAVLIYVAFKIQNIEKWLTKTSRKAEIRNETAVARRMEYHTAGKIHNPSPVSGVLTGRIPSWALKRTGPNREHARDTASQEDLESQGAN